MTRAAKTLALIPVALLLCAPVGAQAKPSEPDDPVVEPGWRSRCCRLTATTTSPMSRRDRGDRGGGPAGRGGGRRVQAKKSAARPA